MGLLDHFYPKSPDFYRWVRLHVEGTTAAPGVTHVLVDEAVGATGTLAGVIRNFLKAREDRFQTPLIKNVIHLCTTWQIFTSAFVDIYTNDTERWIKPLNVDPSQQKYVPRSNHPVAKALRQISLGGPEGKERLDDKAGRNVLFYLASFIGAGMSLAGVIAGGWRGGNPAVKGALKDAAGGARFLLRLGERLYLGDRSFIEWVYGSMTSPTPYEVPATAEG